MKNIDKIKQMNAEEMAEWLFNLTNVLAFNVGNRYVARDRTYLKAWLESEVTDD